jgi:GNAT superfamily N-acetyltransferase
MKSSEENVEVLIAAWSLMVSRFPHAAIQRADGLATMFAHVPLPFINMSVQDRPLVDADDMRKLFAVARARAATCKYTSMLGICEAWAPENWQQIAAEEGFTFALNMTGMAANQLLPLRRPSPILDIRRISDEATARDLAMINAHAYEMPTELFECICNLHLWHNDSFGYVAYASGKAVSCAATFPAGGTVYVAFVATLPGEHGKGYAEMVMRHAIENGRKAKRYSRITLHASDMGHPLYRSMGFESGPRVILLMPSNDPASH